MTRNNVTNPIFAGGQIAAYDASSISNTDWNNLGSDDFYDAISGSQLSAGLTFAFVGVASSSGSTSYIKLRAATGASDGTSNTDGVIPVRGTYQTDSQALVEGSNVVSIAYKKALSTDVFIIYAGFNK